MPESNIDPIIGSWKLDSTKSKYSPNQKPPKGHTEIYRVIDGGLIDFYYELVSGDGSKTIFKATWPVEGGVLNAPEGQIPEGKSYIETLIEPGNWYVTVLQDNKQVGVIHKVVSEDGQTLSQMYKGFDEQGTLIEQITVFKRQ